MNVDFYFSTLFIFMASDHFSDLWDYAAGVDVQGHLALDSPYMQGWEGEWCPPAPH